MNKHLGPFLVVLLVLLTSSVAYAATVNCSSGSTATNQCKGTTAADTITGTGNKDYIDATQGGADSVFGKDGADNINTNDGVADDWVDCGNGADYAKVDVDDFTKNCDSNVDRIPIAPPPPPPPPPDVTCSGVSVTPSQNLSTVAASNPAGTTFCLAPGTYNVSSRVVVEDGDVFSGTSSDVSQTKVVTTADHGFYTSGADNAVIKYLDVSGALHNNTCEPGCGRGIGGGGSNLTVDNVRSHNNENQGVGGTGAGLVIRSSELDHNGNVDSADDGGSVSAAGVKAVNSFSVFDSNIHDNYWDGVWCDIECNAFEVHDSTLTNNGKAGIHDEISTGPAIFEGNRIEGNGKITGYSTRLGGVLLIGSKNIDTFANTFSGNGGNAVEVATDSRTGGSVSGVKIHDNILNGGTLKGCSLSGVTCANNT